MSRTELKEIRRSGIIMVLMGCILVAAGLWLHRSVPVIVFGMVGLIGLGFVIMPGPLQRLHQAWLTGARTIGKVITIIILTVGYYLVITPAALIKRLLGGIPLPTRPDAHSETYWVARPGSDEALEQYHKRY
jgi:hypothetical protein